MPRKTSSLITAKRRQAATGLAMAAPALILLACFFAVPVVLGVALSLTNARLVSPNPPSFLGLENYIRAFTADSTFLRSLLNTAAFAAVIVPVQAGLALVLAVLVNQRLRGTTFFRIVYFIPVVTSIVVVSILWRFMYQKHGLINSMIDTLTFGQWQGLAWLDDPKTALPAIMVLSIWQAVGFHMVIWLSGLQTIPEELYEAARIDGATPWKQFTHVTWPGLRPTMVFILVTITIAALGLFVQIDVITQGGPLDSTTTVVYHAVMKGYKQQEVGYGAAISLIFFIAVLAVALIQRRLTRDKD